MSDISDQRSMNFFTTSKYVKELKPSDFDQIDTWKLKQKGPHLVMFYCDWCSYCKDLKDVWEEVAKTAIFCTMAAFNCNTNPEHTEKIKYDKPDLISGYPTIIIYNNSESLEEYTGPRDAKNLIKICMRAAS